MNWDERQSAMREELRECDAVNEISGRVLLVHRALGDPYAARGDSLTPTQVAEALRGLHAAGADDDSLASTVRAFVGDDVHRAAAVCRASQCSDAYPHARSALLDATRYADRDAEGTARQYARAAELLLFAATDHLRPKDHVEQLAAYALRLTDGVAPVAANSLALAATLTTGSTYMLLAEAVERMLSTW